MKKTLALLLAITMLATICVGCVPQKPEQPPVTTPIVDTPPVETPTDDPETTNPTEDTKPTEPADVERYEDAKIKYSALAAYNGEYSNIENGNFDELLENGNLEALDNFMTKMGQTVVLIPQKDKYEYSTQDEGCLISSGLNMVEVFLISDDDINDIAKDMTNIEKLSYQSHSGTLYKKKGITDITCAYIGSTQNKTKIVVIGYSTDMVKEIVEDIIVIESDFGKPVDDDTIRKTLNSDAAIATNSNYQLVLSYTNSEKHKTVTNEYGIGLLDKNEEYEVHIELDDPDLVANQITEYTNDEDTENIKYIETENVFGFAFSQYENSVFYGFDKDTFGAIVIDGETCPLDDLYNIIKDINVTKWSFNDTIIQTIEMSRALLDQSAANELGVIFELRLSDNTDMYNELLPYVCDGNVSSYVDAFPDTPEDTKVPYDCTHDTEHYYYNNDARLNNGMYSVAGNMNGFTITFYPTESNGKYVYRIADGIINEYIKPGNTVQGREDIEIKYHNNTTPDYEKHGTLSTMETSYMYDYIKKIIGDRIEIASTYHHSVPLTIFVAIDGTNIHVESQFGGLVN